MLQGVKVRVLSWAPSILSERLVHGRSRKIRRRKLSGLEAMGAVLSLREESAAQSQIARRASLKRDAWQGTRRDARTHVQIAG